MNYGTDFKDYFTKHLGKSDFFTSAFPAQYGNANGGVFDLMLREGNN